MPVYLCRPGHASTEPWRHGVQVYAYPFRIDGTAAAGATIGDAGGGSGGGAAAVASVGNNEDRPSEAAAAAAAAAAASALASTRPATDTAVAGEVAAVAAVTTDRAASAGVGVAVRRVRHAEVVLADEVSAAYGRYWLRLRWPGPRGGIAGYIALGVVPPGGALGAGAGLAAGGGGGELVGAGGAGSATARRQRELAAAVAASDAASGEREFRYRTQVSGEFVVLQRCIDTVSSTRNATQSALSHSRTNTCNSYLHIPVVWSYLTLFSFALRNTFLCRGI